jgi:AcrR family transcriptional regulator
LSLRDNGPVEVVVGLRERKKDKLRHALFASALRLFQERGFAATSIDDIVASVDVSRKTFFRYFNAKEDVIVIDEERKVAIVERALRERSVDETVPAAVGRSLRELASYYAAEADVVRALYRLGSAEPVLAHRLLEHHATWQQAVARSVATSLGVDSATDIRPHVIAASALAAARLGLTEWVGRDCLGTPDRAIGRQFDSVRPALELLVAANGNDDARNDG